MKNENENKHDADVEQDKPLFDMGREAYTDACDGTWISSPNNIRPGSVPFAKWEAGLKFELNKQQNMGLFKRVLWAGCV